MNVFFDFTKNVKMGFLKLKGEWVYLDNGFPIGKIHLLLPLFPGMIFFFDGKLFSMKSRSRDAHGKPLSSLYWIKEDQKIIFQGKLGRLMFKKFRL